MTTGPPATSRQPCTVAAVILAAGSSRRFGADNKLLARVSGRPLIAWTVSAFADSRVTDRVVVTGPDRAETEQALARQPVRFAHNADHLAGMGGSIAVGAATIPRSARGVLICPGDMPGVSKSLITRLIDTFMATGTERIVRPVLADGRPGHPVLWPRRMLGELMSLSGPEGGRSLLERHAANVVLVTADEDAALDIDTLAELEAFRDRMRDMRDS